jgi:catechol 2,3-dioxygenase-like lactoylglutathione lyase family enzyme
MQTTGLELKTMVGFVFTTEPAKAKQFYSDVLGFRLLTDDAFALAFDANGALLRVAKAQKFTPASHTIAGWEVTDIHAAVEALAEKGVQFERFPGTPTGSARFLAATKSPGLKTRRAASSRFRST